MVFSSGSSFAYGCIRAGMCVKIRLRGRVFISESFEDMLEAVGPEEEIVQTVAIIFFGKHKIIRIYNILFHELSIYY